MLSEKGKIRMYRYYRFFMVNNYGSSYLGVSEMEFLDKNNIDLTDSLSPTSFTASSSFNSGYSASKVFDNIWNTNNTAWLSASGKNSDQWITVDFGEQVEVFKINYQSDAYDSGRVGVKDYRIEGSNDNNSWNVLFTGSFEMSTNIEKINLKAYKATIKNQTTNKYYSLSDNTLIHLPNALDKNMILYGIEQSKEIQLDVPFDKMKYINESSIGKVFTQGIKSSKTLKIKEVEKEYTPIYNWFETEMTSNTAPAPFVASASDQQAGYEAYKAFNTLNSASDTWMTNSEVRKGWVQLDLGEEKVFNHVKITSRNGLGFNTHSPKDFEVLASNDNNVFTTLGSFNNNSSWTNYEQKVFTFNNTNPYRYYRINVLTNNGGVIVAINNILFGYKREVN